MGAEVQPQPHGSQCPRSLDMTAIQTDMVLDALEGGAVIERKGAGSGSCF